MKKTVIYIAIAALMVTIGYFILRGKKELPVTVQTTSVKTGSIKKIITATGTVEPITQVQVGTQVSGVIEKIYVDYNSKVKANQLIAELEKTTLKAGVAEAQASLNNALNEKDYQQRNFDRIAKLHENRVVSDTDYEEALYKLNNAKGVVDQKKSDLSRAKTNLSYANIYSPIDGVVISRSVDVGQTVAASYATPELFTIAQDLSQMQVEADVDEADIGQVKSGQRVAFTVDAYPEDEFSGIVTQVRLEPTETSNVITYTVIIKADNEAGKLMPGLTASISIYTMELNDVLTVEMKALSFQPDVNLMKKYALQHGLEQQQSANPAVKVSDTNDRNAKIVWIKQGDSLIPREIITGSSDGILAEVREGLAGGDEVVYAMAAGTSAPSEPEGDSGSPFMPKPPAAKKK